MTFSRGDVVWLKIDILEGGVGKPHPAVVISGNAFNDSHDYGIVVRGSSRIPAQPAPDELVVQKNPENGLDEDTVFLPIIQSAKWNRVTKKVGVLPPYQMKQLSERMGAILEI